VLLPNLEALHRFSPLGRASITLLNSVVRIAEAYIIDLGRAARVVLSGGRCPGYSAPYSNDLCSLSQGKTYFIKLTQNNQASCTCVRHFSPHAEINSFPFQNSIIPSGLKCAISSEMF